MKGTDEELGAASTELEGAVNELSQAVGLTTLGTVQVLNEITQSMNGNVEFLVSNASLIDERTKTMESNINRIMDMQREALQKMAEQSRMFNKCFESIPRPSPPPSGIIPFRRDPDFVKRDVLSDIWERAGEPAARIGLVGLGGVG